MSQVVNPSSGHKSGSVDRVDRPNSEQRAMSIEEMVRERLQIQAELAKAYPEMPVISIDTVNSFKDYAYAAHDQASFLHRAMTELKSMNESHFVVKKNKELMREKKALEEQLSLAQSQGPS